MVWRGVDGVVWRLHTAQTSGHGWGWGDDEATTILAYTSHLIQYVTGMIIWLTTISHGSRSHMADGLASLTISHDALADTAAM